MKEIFQVPVLKWMVIALVIEIALILMCYSYFWIIDIRDAIKSLGCRRGWW